VGATDRTVGAITECLAPTFPVEEPASRAAVLADVTAFVVSQVGALPDFLRYPYRLALFAFEWLAVLRYGRPFAGLDPERRQAWVELWAESPIGATRNFVKLIRSCALLAYYDHPAVQAPLNAQVTRATPRPVPALAVPTPERRGAVS
jgi:hypothetical protein